jgi:hypothetical protein
MAAFDPWGNALAYDLAKLTDSELIELFGIPEDAERVIPADELASPTLGAMRRQQGVTEDPAHPYDHMLPEAKVLLAFELVQEARRRAIADQLDGVYDGLSHGADPNNIALRLRRLADRAERRRYE